MRRRRRSVKPPGCGTNLLGARRSCALGHARANDRNIRRPLPGRPSLCQQRSQSAQAAIDRHGHDQASRSTGALVAESPRCRPRRNHRSVRSSRTPGAGFRTQPAAYRHAGAPTGENTSGRSIGPGPRARTTALGPAGGRRLGAFRSSGPSQIDPHHDRGPLRTAPLLPRRIGPAPERSPQPPTSARPSSLNPGLGAGFILGAPRIPSSTGQRPLTRPSTRLRPRFCRELDPPGDPRWPPPVGRGPGASGTQANPTHAGRHLPVRRPAPSQSPGRCSKITSPLLSRPTTVARTPSLAQARRNKQSAVTPRDHAARL